MFGMSLAEFLEILSESSAESGPWTEESGAPEILNGAFAEFAKALVAYVKTALVYTDYETVRDSLEQVVHTFPRSEMPELDAFSALEEALLKAMGEAPEAFSTEADGPSGAPKE